MKTRIIATALIRNLAGELLLCKMPENQGIYPGQWAIVGGGMEEGETVEESLRREVMEETGLKIKDICPWTFSDARRIKKMPDGSELDVYMVFLIFDCVAISTDVRLNEEHVDYAWVKTEHLADYDLNATTIQTFKKKGLL